MERKYQQELLENDADIIIIGEWVCHGVAGCAHMAIAFETDARCKTAKTVNFSEMGLEMRNVP